MGHVHAAVGGRRRGGVRRRDRRVPVPARRGAPAVPSAAAARSGRLPRLRHDRLWGGGQLAGPAVRARRAGCGVRGAAAEQLGPGGDGDRERAVTVPGGDGAADRPRARAVVRLRAGPARPGRGGAQPPSHDGHAAAGDRGAGHARRAGHRGAAAGGGEPLTWVRCSRSCS